MVGVLVHLPERPWRAARAAREGAGARGGEAVGAEAGTQAEDQGGGTAALQRGRKRKSLF